MRTPLHDAAEIFAVVVPEWLDPNVVIGQIAGVTICVGDVRKLSAALNESVPIQDWSHISGDAEIIGFLKQRKLIHAIKARREQTGESLSSAKFYVEQLAIVNGLREWRNDMYVWTNETIKVAD